MTKFNVDSNEFKEALESLQVKGKQLRNSGFSSGNLGTTFHAHLYENTLSLYNGDSTFMVKINLTVEGEENGNFVADSSHLLPYLKSFSETITVSVGHFISISDARRNVNNPILVNHPSQEALERLKEMTKHIHYEPQPQTLFAFGNSNFEGAFTLNQIDFQKCIKNCEIVKSGIYRLNFHQNTVTLSSRINASNQYSENLNTVFTLGESATLDFSSPLYSFFNKDQLLNFYVRDEFPLLIVSDDRVLVKAPHVGGN